VTKTHLSFSLKYCAIFFEGFEMDHELTRNNNELVITATSSDLKNVIKTKYPIFTYVYIILHNRKPNLT